MNTELQSQRLKAAVLTGGTSVGPVYDLVMRICRQEGIKGTILDYGAGVGTLLGILGSEFPDSKLVGADILPRPQSLSPNVDWVQKDLNESLPIPDASFDAIVSSEVIEHLENPRAMFRDIYRLLKPHGLLIVTTPNQESIRSLAALLITGHFAYFSDNCYPAHIVALLEKDFQRICKETGFTSFEFQFSDSGGIPKMPVRTWQSILPFLKGRLFSDNIAVVCRKT